MPVLVILHAIWDLLVISTDASADPYIFRVISYQCPAQCLLKMFWSKVIPTDVLACMEVVRLAEMWSQGMFIDRGHGLAVVVVVLQL